ncbi:hypothetical protein bcere0018_57170 [Bacillus cereus Rock1-15]|nr:hypothetical protein FORC47_p385 [Bacillus cereus]EEL25241.1 hypothetical protein bcere0018_57170 [Bacillus cereus Rock1-15]
MELLAAAKKLLEKAPLYGSLFFMYIIYYPIHQFYYKHI